MQGKSADEVARMTQDFYNEALTLRNQPQAPQSYQHPAPQGPTPPDPNLMYSNPAQYQQQLIAYNNAITQAALSQMASSMHAPLAENARELSRIGSFKDIWSRYEPEIENELRGIPAHARTKQIYDKAAELVKAAHLEDIVQERLERAMAGAGGSGTERSHVAGGSNLPPVDKLDSVYDSDHPFFVNARNEGVTKQMIRDHCNRMKISVDQYVADSTSGVVVLGRNGFERRSV